MSVRPLAVLTLVVTLAFVPAAPAGPATGRAATIVRLTAAATCVESASLAAAPGASLIDAKLRLWRLEPTLAKTLVPALRGRGAIAALQLERSYVVAATAEAPDPFEADEWWRSQIGIDGLVPPGRGVPVTIVDSGIDVTHP